MPGPKHPQPQARRERTTPPGDSGCWIAPARRRAWRMQAEACKTRRDRVAARPARAIERPAARTAWPRSAVIMVPPPCAHGTRLGRRRAPATYRIPERHWPEHFACTRSRGSWCADSVAASLSFAATAPGLPPRQPGGDRRPSATAPAASCSGLPPNMRREDGLSHPLRTLRRDDADLPGSTRNQSGRDGILL